MKHLLPFFHLKKTVLLFLLAELISFSMSANPGDTTWVTVFNNRKITQYGNYDTVASFPTNLTYRKIRLHYILGRYNCPPNEQYCGDWDYTTLIHALPAGLDTVQIARVITPYAGNWPLTKKHDYVIDVTDYAAVLQGITSMRFKYEGYSWGFTVTLRFEFIEGTPPRDALFVKSIYDGYFKYGVNASPIENFLSPKTYSYAAPVASAVVRNTISGHGADTLSACSEFCDKYYQLLINNSQVAQKQIWKNDCGKNNIYSQNGTWIFDRANWCPGEPVWPVYHDLSGWVTANSSFSVNIDMEPYTSSDQYGNQGYHFATQLIGYGAANYNTDVAIEDIIAPTKDPNYFRSNPTCNNAVIKIKNTGSSPVSSVALSYGLAGYAPDTYTWTGLLNSMEETEVSMMPAAPMFTNAVDANFSVTVVSVNGAGADQNALNDTYRSVAPPVTIYPSDFVVRLFTNNATDPNTQANETSWTLYDAFDNVIASRTSNPNNTVLRDTLSLQPGCYRFKVEDSGCDGYAWWFYPNYPVNPGNGTLRFDDINGFTTLVNFTGDVGCGFTKYFKVLSSINVNIPSFVSNNVVEVYPNPAGETAYIKLDLNTTQDASYRISDVNGRLIAQKSLSKVVASYEKVDLGGLSNGVYIVSVQLSNGEVFTKKLVVQK
jgi:hypothetical protein